MSEAHLDEVETSAPGTSREIQHIVDRRLTAVQSARAAHRRRMEWIKFGVLVAILLITVFVIAVARPLIFGRIVPAVMGGDADSLVTAPDNTQNLPIISVPGSGMGGEAEATAVPDNDQSSVSEGETAVPGQVYVVQPGDTLNSIARQFNTTVEMITAANSIQNPDALLVGAALIIPQP